MSSKLAKVLLICALCVALPLFIAGTVIAVYYSMNAVTNVYVYSNGKYVEAPTITSSAKVEEGETLGAPQYRVINGHSKTTTVDFEGEGYNFEFWFKGSHQEYVEILGRLSEAEKGENAEEISAIQSELDGKKISLSAPLSIKTGDYEDITAVFSVVTYTVKYDNNTTITVKDGTFEGSSDNFSNGIWYGEATSQLMIEDGDFIGEATSGLYFYTAPGTNRSPSNVQLYGGRYWGSPQSDSYMRDEWYYQGAIGNPNSRGSFLGIPTGYNGLEIPLSSIIASGKNVYDASGVQIYSGSNGDSIRYNVSSQSYVTIR